MEKMKNHIVCIPYPAQGHIKPMLKLAQLLHFIFGFHVTFLNTHYIHKTYFQNHPSSSSSSSSNNDAIFKFEYFPESFDYDSNDLLPLITAILNDELKLPLKEILMSKLSSISSDNDSRLCCMISDVAMSSFTLGVAQELGIRTVMLETASPCSLLAYFNTRQLLDKGIVPLRDKGDLTNGYLEQEIDWIPSLKGICLKDMPTSIRTTNPDDMFLNITLLNSNRALNSKTTTLILNTFDALDQDVLRDLSIISPNIYPIGPLHSMVEHHISKNNSGDAISIGPTISCEDDEHMMMNWLDSQEPNSVLYVSFGTLVGVTQETLVELAWGLANSHSNFLWIMRPGLVIGGRDSLEFDRFQKEVEGRGVLANWCDQERVLSHSSIGGFLTHCGWNSTIESISNGVPMICWPFVADQTTNSWRCCHGLGIGVKMAEEVHRDAIEKVVKELMHEQKGKEIRASAMKWKELTKEAIMKLQGSSYVNLDNLVKNILKI